MDNSRMMELLRAAVGQIESFEDDEAEYVLRSLGFTKNELTEIRNEIHIKDEDKENIFMVEGKVIHNGEVVWILNRAGASYIFSDQKETETGWATECVPFKNYHHYVDIINDGEKYVAYAWYNKNESYIQEFTDWDKCLDWLVGCEREHLWVCEHCLWAIQSREGNLPTLVHYIDEDDKNSKCDWCGDDRHDTLYELI